MKSYVFVLAFPLFVGCDRAEPDATLQQAARVYTVSDFLKWPELRRRTNALCSNDPGRLGHDPNCINVQRANRIAGVGSMSDVVRTAH
jgi:hypothetical protein